jgi:glutaredoxin
MVTDDHVCPFGIRARDLLKRHDFTVDDNHLETRAETDAFKDRFDVDTTPQVFIGDRRVGGYDELRSFLDLPPLRAKGKTYKPVIAVFGTAFLMALSAASLLPGGIISAKALELFIAFSMCLLALLKLRDLHGFVDRVITYDILGRRFVRYAYLYPFVEGGAGILMISKTLTAIAAPAVLVVATIGAASVVKAVYIEKRDLSCACVGGDTEVPLGFLSLTENLMMVTMALWMLFG